jgi:hypothetical protein
LKGDLTVLKALTLSSLILLLTACSNGEKLASSSGPLFQLNADHWQATPDDLSPASTGRAS